MSKRKSDLAQATVDAGDSLSSTVESAIGSTTQAVASGIDDLVAKGRKARKQAKAEAERRRREAKQAASRKARKAQRKAQKTAKQLGDDLKADAKFRKEALAAAAQGDPKRRGTIRKLLRTAAVLGGAGFVASKVLASKKGGKSPVG